MTKITLTVEDALALLQKTSLPTVITEGSDDYRVMRKIENKLADLDVDFLPLGGKSTVLAIWSLLSPPQRRRVLAIVDLDVWMLSEIPVNYRGDGILYTQGFSIENDIFMDADLLGLCDTDEVAEFMDDLSLVAGWFSRQIWNAKNGNPYVLQSHVNEVIAKGDIGATLSAEEMAIKNVTMRHFPQVLRGKTLFELLVRQLNRPNRFAKFGYKQVYEIGSFRTGDIFDNLELKIRSYFA